MPIVILKGKFHFVPSDIYKLCTLILDNGCDNNKCSRVSYWRNHGVCQIHVWCHFSIEFSRHWKLVVPSRTCISTCFLIAGAFYPVEGAIYCQLNVAYLGFAFSTKHFYKFIGGLKSNCNFHAFPKIFMFFLLQPTSLKVRLFLKMLL